MISIGTPLASNSTRLLLLGSGELGKEMAIEAQRLGVETIAVDRYENAPAMQIAHRSHVISMLDGESIRSIVENEKPHLIVPEIEAINTDSLIQLEKEGWNVVPTARATKLTMDRQGIRELAAVNLGLPTSPYKFAASHNEVLEALEQIGLPAIIKPVMSSSGRGQSLINSKSEAQNAWEYAINNARGDTPRVIVEGFVSFDYEITLLTIRHLQGTSFCDPIGHLQIDGDYRESWQPHPMGSEVLIKAKEIAKNITDELGGYGVFGVELFIKGEDVFFSEVSPRPHDTGMVTLISQNLSEFALHIRAILGLPIPNINQFGPSASCAILGEGNSSVISYGQIDAALSLVNTNVRLFGKPEIEGHRRLGVALACGDSIVEAREKARYVEQQIRLTFS
tara:strand:- start:9389 stop:10573 length:1185 start_codon:yes stop_codon:yes gene_type:complete